MKQIQVKSEHCTIVATIHPQMQLTREEQQRVRAEMTDALMKVLNDGRVPYIGSYLSDLTVK